MAGAFAVSRNHLIFGLCLPLAILLGYLLAEPLESTSLAIVIMVLAVLAVPVLMRWYHPLLIVSWNAAVTPYFLPGQPQLWILMAGLGLLFAVLNRSVNPAHQFLHVPALIRPLLVLLVVVAATAMTTGGFGMAVLGSESYGGKGYFYLAAAAAGYFALTSRPIPPARAQLYVALFFLSGLTAIVSHLAYVAGPKFYFLYELFPVSTALDQAAADMALDKGMVRLGGLPTAAQAIFSFLLARYGIEGVFNFAKPWRGILFFGALMASTFGGFRSAIIFMGLTFAISFYLERLWRTRVFLMLIFIGTLGGVLLLGFAKHFPPSVQRAISFLPVNIDPLIQQSAETSTDWRLEMWKAVVPQIPQYLFKGKGYALSPDDVYLVGESTWRGLTTSWEGAALAGDYHSGPLSVIIPFGIYGVVAFGWLLAAGTRYLHGNYRRSPPALRRINRYLFALFVARMVFFVLVYGHFKVELYYLVGILGLSVALNANTRQLKEQNEEPPLPEIGWSR